jgi:tetratricopeptide (TPR) repeat protein
MSSRALHVGIVATLVAAGCASARPARVGPMQTGGGLSAGVAAYRAGQYAQAEQALRDQQDPEAKAYLAAALAKQKKWDEVEVPATSALAAVPSQPTAAGALGEALVALGRYDDAVARMSAVINADKAVAYAFYWRGHAHSRKKQADRMISDFEVFLKLAPDAPEAETVRQLLSALR